MNNLAKHQAGAVLFTINVPSLVRFYENVAGLTVFRTEKDHVRLENGMFRLTVHKIPPRFAKNIKIAVPPAIRENNAIKLAFHVVDIASSRKMAAQLGGAVFPVKREWRYEGMTVCDGYDPDGNVFQLFAFSRGAAAVR